MYEVYARLGQRGKGRLLKINLQSNSVLGLVLCESEPR